MATLSTLKTDIISSEKEAHLQQEVGKLSERSTSLPLEVLDEIKAQQQIISSIGSGSLFVTIYLEITQVRFVQG